MKALILAAGYATRLYPITKEYPKPLLEVGNRPLIDYIVDKLAAVRECEEIIVVTNSKFISKFRSWAKKRKSVIRISLVDDLSRSLADKRGAIGDMYFAVTKKRLKDDLLVIGGDNLFDGNLANFVSFAKTKKNCTCIGVYKLRSKKEASKYGVIRINKNNRVVDFKEKPRIAASALVAMCLYYFPKAKSALIKEYMINKAQKRDAVGFYIDWLRKKEPMYGYVFKGRWYDIGDKGFYNKARENFSKGGQG